jgi:site-specific recombinase XerD
MMLGHASVATTEIYTQLAIDDLKAVCRRAHPHGRRDFIPD